MLFLGCLIVLANYYCYDQPAALENEIEAEFKIDKATFGLLYTFYAIPNLFMPILGGFLFDKIGTSYGIVIFSVIVCFGQGLYVMGCNTERLWWNLALTGRFIFGIGCEAMYVGQSAIVSEWFIDFELPFAISMISFVPLFGSFASGALIPSIYFRNSF